MVDDFDEFFDDELAERDPASERKAEPPHASAPASAAEADDRRPSAGVVAASEPARPERQSPPFWMVLAIAGISLVLGVVIGYLVGTTVTISELGSGEDRGQSAATDDAAVDMPEGHPEVELDEEGNATIAGDGADSDAGDPVTDDPLTLANNFFDMGMSAMNGAKNEEDQRKAQDVFRQAVVHYDEYLKDSSSPAAEVDRAICVFYAGDHEQAIADLEAFVERDASFAPAWANLGMFYESHGDTAEAKKAYRKAVDAASKEDAYGVGDYARQRLDVLSK